MKVPETHITGRAGVVNVDRIFTENFGWLFREQSVSDLGIDAHVEIVRDGRATGKLIGLQIKSGESYLSDTNEQGMRLYLSNSNIDYWLNHSLPVLVVVYSPEQKKPFGRPLGQIQ